MQQLLHQTLKEETKLIHAQLEKRLMERISMIKGVRDYVSLLHLFYEYYSAIESRISQHINEADYPDFPDRRKAVMILSDIKLLLPAFESRPDCHVVPNIQSSANALGAMYVLEGSTLGGRIVASIIAKRINTQSGLGFFLSYGEEVNRKWADFKEYLNRPFTEEEQTQIIEGARQTFLTLNQWLNECK